MAWFFHYLLPALGVLIIGAVLYEAIPGQHGAPGARSRMKLLLRHARASDLVFLVPAALLLMAPLPLPYVFYLALRQVVFVCAVWAAFMLFGRRLHATAMLFLVAAAVFNPVIRLHLERETWAIINVVAAVIFACGVLSVRNGPGARSFSVWIAAIIEAEVAPWRAAIAKWRAGRSE